MRKYVVSFNTNIKYKMIKFIISYIFSKNIIKI